VNGLVEGGVLGRSVGRDDRNNGGEELSPWGGRLGRQELGEMC